MRNWCRAEASAEAILSNAVPAMEVFAVAVGSVLAAGVQGIAFCSMFTAARAASFTVATCGLVPCFGSRIARLGGVGCAAVLGAPAC